MILFLYIKQWRLILVQGRISLWEFMQSGSYSLLSIRRFATFSHTASEPRLVIGFKKEKVN